MSKPEVVATTFTMAVIAAPNIGGERTHVSPLIEMPAGTQLIRLADYERLQADHEADKARIAAQQWLLEMCQQSLSENGESYCELNAYLRGDIDHNEVLAIKAEHEAALSQQGKEGD